MSIFKLDIISTAQNYTILDLVARLTHEFVYFWVDKRCFMTTTSTINYKNNNNNEIFVNKLVYIFYFYIILI